MTKIRKKVPIHELVRIVAEDLIYLKGIDFSVARRTEVRIAAGILRRLLYEGLLSAAWKALRMTGELEFDAVDLAAVLKDVPSRYIHYAYAGGAKLPGAHYMGQAFLVVPKGEIEAMGGPEEAARQVDVLLKPYQVRSFALGEFSVSPCVVTGDAAVARVDLVRYVANKLGGVHLDAGRGAWTHPLGSRYRFLDEMHIKVGRFPAPYYETISIAQSVAQSESAKQLVEEADNQFPEENAPENVLSFREGRVGKYADMTFAPPDASASKMSSGSSDE